MEGIIGGKTQILQRSRSNELLPACLPGVNNNNSRKYKFLKFIAIVGMYQYQILHNNKDNNGTHSRLYITQPALVTGNKIILAKYAILQFERIITNSELSGSPVKIA